MVLCHDCENPVWGTAAAGADVEICLGAICRHVIADLNGFWTVKILAPSAGTVTEMRITCGDERIVFENVASGEVWLACGQSNMEMPVMCTNEGSALANSSTFPNVRLKTVTRRCCATPQLGWHFYPTGYNEDAWEMPTKLNVARFSAIGYSFGALLSESLKMPVGVISCNWGGTKIQCWMPAKVLLEHEDTRNDVATYIAAREALGHEEARRHFELFQRSVSEIAERLPDFYEHSLADPLYYLQEDAKVHYPPEGADGDPQRPGCLFENMIARVAPFSIRGVLWYQGESNALLSEANRYASLFQRMREAWQSAWGDKNLPFLTCQLAAFDPSRWGNQFDWPGLRRQQALCVETLSRVSMAILVDLGDRLNIHPLRKKEVAERLHAIALSDVYRIAVKSHSPVPIACTRECNCVRLHFDGSVTLQAGDFPLLRSTQHVEQSHMCQTDARTLLLIPEKTSDWYSVEYLSAAWVSPSIFGEEGLPVAPFVLPISDII